MTPKRFAKSVMTQVVDDGVESYRQIFARPGVVTDPYWARVLELYRSLPAGSAR